MKEGKLSSALQERYGIREEDAIGTVLWHSLNESGEIGVYDMKFGDTVIRNLTEADVESTVEEGHGHSETISGHRNHQRPSGTGWTREKYPFLALEGRC